jgi:hypothetical protein
VEHPHRRRARITIAAAAAYCVPARVGLATGLGVSLVGDGTGVAEAGTRLGEAQDPADVRGGEVGTGAGTAVGGQVATTVGFADGTGIGAAVPAPCGREVTTGTGAARVGVGVAGDVRAGTGVAEPVPADTGAAVSRVAGALAECDARVAAAASPVAEAAPEHPVSASPAATPNTAPIATSDGAFPARLRALGTPVFPRRALLPLLASARPKAASSLVAPPSYLGRPSSVQRPPRASARGILVPRSSLLSPDRGAPFGSRDF